MALNWNTHIAHHAEAVGWEGLVLQIPILTPEYLFTYILVGSSSLSYLNSSATVQIHPLPVDTTPKCGSKPIWYVMLHFWD